jgi:hypothetical protein
MEGVFMKQTKQLVASFLMATALILANAINVSAATLDTGNSRTNIRIRDDESVVTNVERAYSALMVTLSGIRIADGAGRDTSGEAAVQIDQLELANDSLQEHSFNSNISSLYTSASEEVRDASQELTNTATSLGDAVTSREDVIAAQEALAQPASEFEAAVSRLEQGATEYSPNNFLALVIIGAVLVAIFVSIGLLVARQNKKSAKLIFGDNPKADALTPEQKKLVVKVYKDISLYEAALAGRNNDLAQALEMGAYKTFFERTDQDSFGSFAAYAYELRALVNIRLNNLEQAKLDALKAYELYGSDKFTSTRVRQLAMQTNS